MIVTLEHILPRLFPIAIVGSRKASPQTIMNVHTFVLELARLPDVLVVSGGAIGVDTTAVDKARLLGLSTFVIRPHDPSDNRAYLARNGEIAMVARVCYAFWDQPTSGTLNAIGWFGQFNKPVNVIPPDIFHSLHWASNLVTNLQHYIATGATP